MGRVRRELPKAEEGRTFFQRGMARREYPEQNTGATKSFVIFMVPEWFEQQ